MADQAHVPGTMNSDEQRSTFNGVMKFSGQWGIPASMAIGAFFTLLLINSGILGGFIGAIVTFIFFRWVLMTFFAH
jgi:hypothetical protein